MFLKPILITLGTLSLCIGIIGIFVPGLPTTPFLLLTAGLYLRSSQRLYQLLLRNKYLGSRILEYQRNKGITRRTKIFSISMMWTMIFVSAFVFIDSLTVRFILMGAGIVGTIVMGFVIPTVNENSH